MSKHLHKFTPHPGILGASCICGVTRFVNRYGLAEYDPKKGVTIRLSDRKVLYVRPT